jgi:hypothetical protein
VNLCRCTFFPLVCHQPSTSNVTVGGAFVLGNGDYDATMLMDTALSSGNLVVLVTFNYRYTSGVSFRLISAD